ncbi:MAG TPA: PAS domain S-box protein [Gemmatimonadaceae bacterium]|nr:PAS domain S-box protein [Gemmatimonadaceae bacterium]
MTRPGHVAAAIEKASIGFGMLGPDDRWTDANFRLAELLGYTREELVDLHRSKTTHPDDLSDETEELERVRRGEVVSVQLEHRYVRRDGSPLWVTSIVARANPTRGAADQLVIVVSDLTARRESQRGLSVQHLISRVIAASKTPKETVSAALAEVSKALRWSYAAYWERRKDGSALTAVQTWCGAAHQVAEFEAMTKAAVFKFGEGIPGRVWSTARPLWESDIASSDAYPRRAAASRSGLHSVFAFPIKTSDKLFGVMEFFGEDILPPDQTLLNAAEGVGYQLGEFLDRSRALTAEHESEVRKASILDTALDCIITSDESGVIIEFNPAAETTFGYKKEDVIGKPMVDLIIPPVHREAHTRGMARYLATGEAHVLGKRIEIEAMRSDQSVFPVELAIVRVPLPGPAFFTAYLRDLTERRRLEEEQQRLLAESTEANRAKAEFLATMSHELRTPLNAIGGYAELLRMGIRGPVNEAQVADLERINRSQAHLLAVINDILQFAKIEAGQLEIEEHNFPLASALAAAEELVKPQADAKKISLSFERSDESILVRADRDRFQQIVLNLLSNALKFTPEAGTVKVTSSSTPEQVSVLVADSGVGIPADQLERIFDPFVQVQSGPTRTSDGVGLGLAISRDMARQMGGDVSAESRAGEGSTFTLTLPKGS